MIDKSSLLKSQGSLYLEFIPKDGLFHKMLLLSLMGFLTGWCNLYTDDLPHLSLMSTMVLVLIRHVITCRPIQKTFLQQITMTFKFNGQGLIAYLIYRF